MSKQQTVTINGVHYDPHSGMRIDSDAPKHIHQAVEPAQSSQTHHAAVARSRTLRSRTSHAPVHRKTAAPKLAAKQPLKHPKPATATSPMIRKFAADVTPAKKPITSPKHIVSDIAPSLHPVQRRAAANPAAHAAPKPQPKSAPQIKQEAIAKALDQSGGPKKPSKAKRPSFFKRHPKVLSAGSLSLMILFIGAYLTYTNLPMLSMRVAAMQSGINASLPSYNPSGYSLNGPIGYENGQVTMNYHANGGPQTFSITQSESAWDSSALLENFVAKASEANYDTFTDSGLTVYIFGTNAAWVNGGVLHSLQGDAPLTHDQMRRIATSM